MSKEFASVDQAFLALANPGTPDWGAAFDYLSRHPDTARMMLETFRETLQQMGIAPTGTDPETGDPVYSLEDVAAAMGVSEADLDASAPQPRDAED